MSSLDAPSLASRILARDIHFHLAEKGVVAGPHETSAWSHTRESIVCALEAADGNEAIAGQVEWWLHGNGHLRGKAQGAVLRGHIREAVRGFEESELQQQEVLAHAQSQAFDDGVIAAHRGVQRVILHPDCDLEGAPEGIEELEAFAHIQFHEERGDDSVGLFGWNAWVLSDKQAGTGLALLLARYTAMESALEDLLGQFDQAHDALGVARSASAQEAIAVASRLLNKPDA